MKRVLIVDDEEFNLKLMSMLLSGNGYELETSLDGDDASGKVKAFNPDVVLLDMMMPGTDGIETCKRLKGDPETRHIPVIMLTANSDREKKLECLGAGANDFLTKPVDPGELAARIRNLLQLREYERTAMLADSLGITNLALEKERSDLQLALDEISYILQRVEKDRDLSVRFATSGPAESDAVYRISTQFNNMMEMLEAQHRELERAYADLKTAQSRILQSEKMASIGQLAAGVAHEINNPMGFIISNLNSLGKYSERLGDFIAVMEEGVGEFRKAGAPGAEAVARKIEDAKKTLKIEYILDDLGKLIGESLDGADRVKKIVQDLKSFSRLDEAETKAADINEGIESTINIVWNEIKYRAEVLREYGEVPSTKCMPGQLNQVFMNMLVNAAQAIDKKGTIRIRTWHEDGSIYVSIADTGSGIPRDKIDRIFEPFYTTKDVGKGTGLGLSIAYDIIKKHSGEVRVESEIGRGTTFTVKIPVVC